MVVVGRHYNNSGFRLILTRRQKHALDSEFFQLILWPKAETNPNTIWPRRLGLFHTSSSHHHHDIHRCVTRNIIR